MTAVIPAEDKATQTARKRYDRRAPLYDLMMWLMEVLLARRWRKEQWAKVAGRQVLEVGVGTGKNFPYYPPDAEITAIDLSEKMLRRAGKKAARRGLGVRLQQMDAQRLAFPDDTFDCVAGTFVFCSVPDALQGLSEVRRVLRPGGRVLLLEHVLSGNAVAAWLMDLVNPLVVRLTGANINRRTVENVKRSGLTLTRVTTHLLGVVKIIEATKG